MKIIDVYELTSNADTTEGRGGLVHRGFFVNQSDAIVVNNHPDFYKKYGVMGCPQEAKYYVTKHQLVIYESVKDYFSDKTEELRKHALSKLTEEEKKALGLK